ncbi:MAG: Hsp20/alpha crystallin family protein [Nitrospirota bacterium]|nr:Hsp20/alpha crystallin family protein [Nitrospirota bacterium]MDH5586175.1 Hsp20/alpha crystallin family protein [Nitrospirota bacterium]MDH5773602.1 Hsp20/alpha crystallin family protein [Nitrospirota bacterium]
MTQDIQARDKQELQSTSEQTTPRRVFSPLVDIFEDDQALTIIADMPGVPSNNVSIDLQEDILTLTGAPSLAVPDNEEIVVQEFETGKYFRQFTLSEVIDQANIKANLNHGVLRVTLPKIGPAKPRKVQITEN